MTPHDRAVMMTKWNTLFREWSAKVPMSAGKEDSRVEQYDMLRGVFAKFMVERYGWNVNEINTAFLESGWRPPFGWSQVDDWDVELRQLFMDHIWSLVVIKTWSMVFARWVLDQGHGVVTDDTYAMLREVFAKEWSGRLGTNESVVHVVIDGRGWKPAGSR